jgi:hypothetical protein
VTDPTFSTFTILVQYRGETGKLGETGIDFPFAVTVEEAIPEVVGTLPAILPTLMRKAAIDAETAA